MTSVGSTLTISKPRYPGRYSAPTTFHSSAVCKRLMSMDPPVGVRLSEPHTVPRPWRHGVRPAGSDPSSMLRLGLLERRDGLGARLLLVPRLPFLVGHAVDDLARGVLRELHASLGGRLLVPIGEAVAAEAGEVHEVDVLHIGALAEVLDEPPEGGGFELRRQVLVELGHLPSPSLSCARIASAGASAWHGSALSARRGAIAESRKTLSMMRQRRRLQVSCPAASRIRSWRISMMALASPRCAPCCHRQSPASCPA